MKIISAAVSVHNIAVVSINAKKSVKYSSPQKVEAQKKIIVIDVGC